MIKNLIFDFGKVLVDYEYFTSVRDNELYLKAL